jgi:acyl-CoA hydrolase
MRKVKRVEESLTEQTYMVMPQDINGYGRLFGGKLMQWIDIMAGIVSKRHAETEITTVAVDNLYFKHGAYLNDMIVLSGKVTYVGKTSVEVRVDTYREELDGTRRMINRAYVVMVGIDQEGKPVEVPLLLVDTAVQKAEWESGIKRYELRKERRIEGY